MNSEEMKENFGPVGTIGSSQNKEICDKLDQIIAGINEINSNLLGVKPVLSETKEVEEKIIEKEPEEVAVKEESVEPEDDAFEKELDEVVRELNEKKQKELEETKEEQVENKDIETTQDFAKEIDNISKELENQPEKEDTFTQINVGTLPTVEEPKKEENDFVDIDTLLSEDASQKQVEEAPIVSEVQEQAKVTPIVENPEVEVSEKPVEEAPITSEVQEQAKVTPEVEKIEPIVEEAPVVTPIAPLEQEPIPVSEVQKGYSIVKEDYVGLTIPENIIKMDGSAQRVVPVSSNDKLLEKQAEKTLVMNNAA
mgnify:CR=1 FL=1